MPISWIDSFLLIFLGTSFGEINQNLWNYLISVKIRYIVNRSFIKFFYRVSFIEFHEFHELALILKWLYLGLKSWLIKMVFTDQHADSLKVILSPNFRILFVEKSGFDWNKWSLKFMICSPFFWRINLVNVIIFFELKHHRIS